MNNRVSDKRLAKIRDDIDAMQEIVDSWDRFQTLPDNNVDILLEELDAALAEGQHDDR